MQENQLCICAAVKTFLLSLHRKHRKRPKAEFKKLKRRKEIATLSRIFCVATWTSFFLHLASTKLSTNILWLQRTREFLFHECKMSHNHTFAEIGKKNGQFGKLFPLQWRISQCQICLYLSVFEWVGTQGYVKYARHPSEWRHEDIPCWQSIQGTEEHDWRQ